MTEIVVGLALLEILGIAVLARLLDQWDGNLQCPHCKLSFQERTRFLMGLSLVSCPFCRHLMIAHKTSNSVVAPKILDFSKTIDDKNE